MISIDMKKAREVYREAIRQARKDRLAAADVAFIRALEAGDADTQKTAAEEKVRLRDATANPAIEKAKTVEALKAAWDEALLGPSPFG